MNHKLRLVVIEDSVPDVSMIEVALKEEGVDYDLTTIGVAPALTQSGEINPGLLVSSYYPSIEVNGAGDLGMTYMQSSFRQYVSMYVTGQKQGAAPGTMQPGVLVHAGVGTYLGTRGGDFSGISVDPVNDTFWAANEYSRSSLDLWGTWVANFALTSSGGVASASSSYPGKAPSSAIDGDRKGLNPGKDAFWNSKDGTSPQWFEVDFSGYKTITEIDLFTTQDDYTSPVEPYATMEFMKYGLTGFDVYGWIESGWAPLPWSRRGNKLVWNQLDLSTSPITVSKIKVSCLGSSADSYSRIAELEAWGKPGAKK